MNNEPILDHAEPKGAEEGHRPAPLCSNVQTWVEHIYVTTYIRRTGPHTRWCAQWWDHAEAIVRLTALWQTWEAARLSTDGHGMADWLRTYLDVINPPLLDPSGPFASCAIDRHQDSSPLVTLVPPPEHWDLV